MDLRPEIAQGLETLASACGLSVEDYLQQLVARELPPTAADAPATKRQRLDSSQWVHQFEEWADSFPTVQIVPDEALSRENLYPDRL